MVVTIDVRAASTLVRPRNQPGHSPGAPGLVEAARAYGVALRILVKVQLPLAMPSIMAGISQSLMLSFVHGGHRSRMIAVGGWARMVLQGHRAPGHVRLNAVVAWALCCWPITLDRVTQAMGRSRAVARATVVAK